MLQLLKTLYPYIKPHRVRALGSVILAILVAGVKTYQAYLVKPVFDKGLSANSTFAEALTPALALLVSAIIFFPTRFFHFYWIRYVVDRATCTIRSQIYNKLQKIPMSFYSSSKQGELMSNMLNDTMVFSQGFRSMIDLIREPLTALFMLCLAIYRDWQLTLVIFAVLPLFLLIFIISGKKVRKNQEDVQIEMGDMTHSIHEGLAGQKITKAFNLQRYIYHRFKRCQELFFNAQMRTTFVEEMAHPLVELVGAIAFSGVIIFAFFRIKSGAITTGDFLGFATALALLMDPIRKFSQANVKLNQARAAGGRIFKLLAVPQEVDHGRHEPVSFNDKIEVKDVTFSYGEGNVVKNLSMEVKKGQKVALVGLSGSGKSTIINLLLGLYPVENGDIQIDGVSTKNIKLTNLRNLFGLVSQDIFLFHDTVMENLTTGDEATESQLDAALNVAYAKEFIEKLPQGIDTVIGDRGTRLSGGQQQRLTIARAFLKDRDVLLFDEATSALDNESEKVVQKALDDLAGDKTVIAVAHRLSTIQDYDQILFLHEGRLVEQGTHNELMSLGGEYAKLYDLSQKSS